MTSSYDGRSSSSEDRLKSVSSNSGNDLINDSIEALTLDEESAEIFKNAKVVINLFAGNLDESEAFLNALNLLGNKQAVVIGVDLTLPNIEDRIALLKEKFPNQFEFHSADAFQFIDSLKTSSVDIITAFGAEYVFGDQNKSINSFANQIERCLIPGGLLIIPTVASDELTRDTHLTDESVGGIYKKPSR